MKTFDEHVLKINKRIEEGVFPKERFNLGVISIGYSILKVLIEIRDKK